MYLGLGDPEDSPDGSGEDLCEGEADGLSGEGTLTAEWVLESEEVWEMGGGEGRGDEPDLGDDFGDDFEREDMVDRLGSKSCSRESK